MRLRVTDQAVACLKGEWAFEAGERVRVYVRYAGGGPEAYALGITKETDVPDEPALYAEAGGIQFFMEEKDSWFLQDSPLTIDAQGLDLRFIVGD